MDGTDVVLTDAQVRRLRRLAYWMDGVTRVPVLGWRIGLDPIIGLIPAGGDTLSALLKLYPMTVAYRAGATRGTLVKMLGDLALDWAVGLVPILGDLLDVRVRGFEKQLRHMGIEPRVRG